MNSQRAPVITGPALSIFNTMMCSNHSNDNLYLTGGNTMNAKHVSLISLIVVCCISWSINSMAVTYDAVVEQAQQRLIELGYDPGPADGKMGSKTVAALQSFQKDNAIQQSGELDEITRQKLGIAAADVLPDPGNLTGIPNPQPGDTMQFRVTGTISGGAIWGTDMYTADSALAVVVVHAGVLKNGETGIVRVRFAPGQESYVGTAKNGVTSSAWESYGISYHVELVRREAEAPDADTGGQEDSVLPDPGTLVSFTEAQPGDSMLFRLTGKASGGSIWGTDTYTTDSVLAVAVVHAGVLQDGEEGIVKVTFAPGQEAYEGSARNGVTSSSWGSYQISYTVEAVLP